MKMSKASVLCCSRRNQRVNLKMFMTLKELHPLKGIWMCNLLGKFRSARVVNLIIQAAF